MMFYVFRGEGGYWRWLLVTASNQVLAECPKGYDRKEDCRAALQLVRNCAIARVHEIPVHLPLEQVPGLQVAMDSF